MSPGRPAAPHRGAPLPHSMQRPRLGLAALIATSLLSACGDSLDARSILRVNGSTTVNPIAAEAAEVLRDELGVEIHVDTQGGSSGGIALLGEGRIDIGMSSKPLTDEDRRRYPDARFVAHRVGEDAVALVVSADVWNGGVRSLSRESMRGIYEGRITDWSEVGGPEQRIVFFNKEPGRGTWEVFADWLYGDADDAPSVSFPEVGGNEETRNKVGGTRGAMAPLSYAWADGKEVFALALETRDGVITPTPESIGSSDYPMSRPLFLITDGDPVGDVKAFIDFVGSPLGRDIVRRHGYLPSPAVTPGE